jgi:putative membrane protein
MNLRTTAATAALLLTLISCAKTETTDGLPASDTTDTSAQSPSTATGDLTTTGNTGGTSSDASPADKEFVSNAGMAGLAEVQMGNVALQKAQHADVKAFAQRMVTDHTKSNEELQQLTATKGLTLPAELAGEHKAGLDHLNTLSGSAFDKAYMEHMVADHGKAVTLFENASNTAQDADIKAFASKTLPVLREHAKLAGEVASKVK